MKINEFIYLIFLIWIHLHDSSTLVWIHYFPTWFWIIDVSFNNNTPTLWLQPTLCGSVDTLVTLVILTFLTYHQWFSSDSNNACVALTDFMLQRKFSHVTKGTHTTPQLLKRYMYAIDSVQNKYHSPILACSVQKSKVSFMNISRSALSCSSVSGNTVTSLAL